MELVLNEIVVSCQVSPRLEAIQEFHDEFAPFYVRFLKDIAILFDFEEVFEFVEEVLEEVVDVNGLLGRIGELVYESKIFV